MGMDGMDKAEVEECIHALDEYYQQKMMHISFEPLQRPHHSKVVMPFIVEPRVLKKKIIA